uniref:Programmed cell death protein 5 n=1 Tax=Hucho hucho TaxID=62062 RepID=A0A4W5M0I6_9TELE
MCFNIHNECLGSSQNSPGQKILSSIGAKGSLVSINGLYLNMSDMMTEMINQKIGNGMDTLGILSSSRDVLIEFELLIFQSLSWNQMNPGDSSNDQQGQQEAKQRETEMRNSILAQVLDQSARARLSNLALVKPEKAKAVENYLIQMARMGQLGGKISETGLIDILEKVSQQTEKKTTVKFNRRKVMDSDDEDDD